MWHSWHTSGCLDAKCGTPLTLLAVLDAKCGTSFTILAVWMKKWHAPLSHFWLFGCKLWHSFHTSCCLDAKCSILSHFLLFVEPLLHFGCLDANCVTPLTFLAVWMQNVALLAHFWLFGCKMWHPFSIFCCLDAKCGTLLTLFAVWIQNVAYFSHFLLFGCKMCDTSPKRTRNEPETKAKRTETSLAPPLALPLALPLAIALARALPLPLALALPQALALPSPSPRPSLSPTPSPRGPIEALHDFFCLVLIFVFCFLFLVFVKVQE